MYVLSIQRGVVAKDVLNHTNSVSIFGNEILFVRVRRGKLICYFMSCFAPYAPYANLYIFSCSSRISPEQFCLAWCINESSCLIWLCLNASYVNVCASVGFNDFDSFIKVGT